MYIGVYCGNSILLAPASSNNISAVIQSFSLRQTIEILACVSIQVSSARKTGASNSHLHVSQKHPPDSTMKIAAVLVILGALAGGSLQQCLTPDSDNTNKPNPLGRQMLYSGQQGFSLALLQAINQLMPDENLFFSPYSTYHALLIAYFLAGHKTEDYLKTLLRLNPSENKFDIYNAYKLDKFSTAIYARNASYEFTNANKIYIANQVDVKACMKNNFVDELDYIDFKKDPETARVGINNWVDTRTHHMIKDLLMPGTIDANTKLVLVNAAYFKGMWENKFDPNQTQSEIFYVSPTKQIMVDMMHVESTFNHDVSETLGAHILEMPYEGDQISMFVFLPPFAKEDALDTLLKKLTLDEFKKIVSRNSLLSKQVQVSFPKFSLEHTIELVPILESLGVGNLFKADADFTGLSSDRSISLGEGIHKARIVVNEKGSQAAAATSFFTFRMLDDEGGNPVEFKCNRPFLFLVYNKDTKTILFTGIYRKQ